MEPTPRTIAVAHAYGLGIDESQRFILFDEFEVDVQPGDIVYITGETGSGKSTLLRALAAQLAAATEFQPVADIAEVHIAAEERVIEGVGRTVDEAMRILAGAGLGEAFLFLRRDSELSDGQRYRYGIAKLIDSPAQTWILDEFCATLDRVTAKVVAYALQRTARRLGRTVLVATTHDDLIEDVQPSLLIRKEFGQIVRVEQRQVLATECTLCPHRSPSNA